MNTKASPILYKASIALCLLLVWPLASMADSSFTAARWSAESAQRNAAVAFRRGEPYLYSSGGFVCSPKYRAEYKAIAKGLAVKSFACGCVIDVFNAEGFSQARYAEHFNNRILALMAEREE
ncbi:hypothetical protein [Marinobacter sp.]|uniref:hypothetical protein n=1 Tax=Marinobacter sp. TaxID=50741 RepID=UPI003A8E6F5D